MAFILDGSANPVGGASVVKDTTLETFMDDVIQASQETPVIVDFWAPWCEPCKTLGPMLERLVNQSAGKVRMVKVNVEEEQQLAAQFQVQTVPMVYAFKGGRPVDGFQGAQPESQLKRFIETLVGGDVNVIDQALAQAKALFDDGDIATASQYYQQILAQDPSNGAAVAGMLRCYLATGRAEEAQAILGKLPEQILAHADVIAVKTELDLLAQGNGDVAALQAQIKADPDDHQARLDLAIATYASGQRSEACDMLLDSIQRDRTWNEEAARKQLLTFFEAMGFADPVSKAARRKLSSIWMS
jgi:putative thioredoxin